MPHAIAAKWTDVVAEKARNSGWWVMGLPPLSPRQQRTVNQKKQSNRQGTCARRHSRRRVNPMDAFNPEAMTPEVAAKLTDRGYILPETWPHPARYALEANGFTGWTVTHPGSIRDELLRGGKMPPLYIAPDGTKLVKVSNGKKPVLVALSKKLSPKLLCLAPRARHPAWMDREKNATPESLKPFLFRKKGEPAPEPTPLPPPVDPKLADVERRIAATPAGQRVSPGLLALRTRLLRYGSGGASVNPNRVRPESKPNAGPVCTGHPPAPPLEVLLSEFERARRLLGQAEEAGQMRSVPARRAVYTRKLQALGTEYALGHPTETKDQFIAWVTERVGQGIDVARYAPARRCLQRSSAGIRIRETRESILASGKVKIVRTPKQIWGKKIPQIQRTWTGVYEKDTKRAVREAKSPNPTPLWLRPVCIRTMTPEERERELARQARRLPDYPDTYTFERIA